MSLVQHRGAYIKGTSEGTSTEEYTRDLGLHNSIFNTESVGYRT